METPGMTPESIDAVARGLTQVRSRRAALAVLLAVAVPARATAEQRCRARDREDEILGYIAEAAAEYGQSEEAMVRVARCESALNPCAVNEDGPYYGLYQFLKSTWRSTPYGDREIFDPKAQALAAGWMWQQGRKNEWVCK
jgi:Transglycosylase SLT domain